jgi:hypothetical protein
MHPDQPRARIGYRGSAVSRARQIALQVLVGLGGALMLASAFVLSLVVLAIGLAVVLIGGGYLWWQTRGLRQQLRERREATQQSPGRRVGEVYEGEVVSQDQTPR